MKLRRPFPFKESLLLMLPLLILLGVAITHHDKGPFKLVVDHARLRILGLEGPKAWIPHGRRVKVMVTLSYTGTQPDWWGEELIPESRVNFVAKNQKDDGSNIGAYYGMEFDRAIGCYLFNYVGAIPADPHFIDGARCVIETRMMDSKPPFPSYAKLETSIPARSMLKSGD